MKSILQREKECYICKTTVNLHKHHCICGSNRKNSEKYGLTVYLCFNHHTGDEGVHTQNAQWFIKLKQIAQKQAMERYNWSIDDFIIIFGQNYLEE